jgi:hypothetical protein
MVLPMQFQMKALDNLTSAPLNNVLHGLQHTATWGKAHVFIVVTPQGEFASHVRHKCR